VCYIAETKDLVAATKDGLQAADAARGGPLSALLRDAERL
jgi:hypothetical protein